MSMMAASYIILFLIGSSLLVDCFPQNNNAVNRPTSNRKPAGQVSSTSTAAPTTRIPPADPTNPIVFKVNNCDCLHTFQYNPVCGTDGQTYGNEGVLLCARSCGNNVSLYLPAACGRNNG